jgi:Family of unknown function (DUF6166)
MSRSKAWELMLAPGWKVYRISRRADGVLVCTVVQRDREPYALRHVVCHSPAGFECGYSGSGPADLALSILADHFGEEPTPVQVRRGELRAWAPHQAFKRDMVASLHLHRGQRAVIAGEDLERWLARWRGAQARQAGRALAQELRSGGAEEGEDEVPFEV